MTIPRVLHLTSARVPLIGTEKRLCRANARVLAGWEIRVWSDADNDALVEMHFPKYVDAYRSLPFGVMRADVARLVYMHVVGGWYADTDYRWFAIPKATQRVVLPMSRDDRLGNAVFGSEPGHPIWTQAIDAIFAQGGLANTTRDRIEHVTGPHILTSLLDAARAYPDVWVAPRAYFHSAVNAIAPEAVGVHHTRGSWRDQTLKWRLGMLRGQALVALQRRRRMRAKISRRSDTASS